jgi:hypothetical protein
MIRNIDDPRPGSALAVPIWIEQRLKATPLC